MIAEDYVSFETVKLLKEKGFDVPCKNYYSIYTEDVKHNLQKKYGAKKNWNSFALAISRPSQSLAMKWLREVHYCVICIIPLTFYGGETVSAWGYNIWANDNLEIDEFDSHKFATYEEAAESAIKYCLEKLI